MNPKIAKEAEAVEFGSALRNFGLNLLVSDVAATVLFLNTGSANEDLSL